jgi:HPt (histidine-containing phosphotransfer) domain-containing protein
MNKNLPGALQPASSESCEEPTGSGETLPVFDRRRLTDLLDLLGREHIACLLVAFRQQIGCGLLKEPREKGDVVTLERQMHNLFSTAGTLGFVALSSSCRRLERALGSGTAIESAFEEAASAIKRAGPELDSLIAEMAK